MSVTTMHEVQWRLVDSFPGNFASPALTSARPCPVCGGLKTKKVFQFDDFQFFSDSASVPKRAQVTQVQCDGCAAVYMDPCYTSSGFGYLFPEAGQSYGAMSERPVEQVQWLKERGLLQDGQVFLDVGCYEGSFLSSLPSGLVRVGVDIDAPAVARGNLKHSGIGVRLYCGPLETFQIPQSPDVISMYHVLEHVANPLEVLRHLRAVSHASTKLVVEVPILEFGATNDINGFFAVQHMTHFSHGSLTRLVRLSGWDIVERQQIDGYNGHRLLLVPGVGAGDVEAAADVLETKKYMAQWFAALASACERVANFGDATRWVIWGGGFHTEMVYQTTQLFSAYRDCEFVIVDSDPLKQGKSWRGINIYSSEALAGVDWTTTRLLVSSYGSQEVIKRVAVQLGAPEGRISCLYDHVTAY
jgi:hypothetical protein